MTLTSGRKAKRVRIYINESDLVAGFPAPIRLVEFLRKRNARGATVLRGNAGFGCTGKLHTLHIVDLAADLPVIVEWVDDADRVEHLLPELSTMVHPGLITVEETTIVLGPLHAVRDISGDLAVAAVMTRNPITVSVETPAGDVVQTMQANGLRAVPVVDQGAPVGMITDSDLVTRAGLATGLSLLDGLDPSDVLAEFERLQPVAAKDIMTSPVVTIPAGAALAEAASAMVHRRLKRLPAVDESGVLVGIVSRVDLLRTATDFPDRERPESLPLASNRDAPIEQVMRRDVPTVFPHTPLPEVVQAVIATSLNRALVVDAEKRVVGLVTAVELLERVTPSLRPNALTALIHRLPFVHPSSEELQSEKHACARTAHDLMTRDFVTVKASAPLGEVIATMVQGAHKLVAVVNDEARLMGVVARADVLRGLLRAAPR